MVQRILTFPFVLAAALIMPAAVSAQENNCAPREGVVARLADKYQERLTGGGLHSENTVLEIWSSDATGSFTVLLTYANGLTCIMASGHNWNSVAQVIMPQDPAS